MSELLKELRERHALAVHVRNDINASIASLTTELAAANCQIWELESACRALEGASAIAGAIVAPEAVEVADEPASLTETPSQAQEILSALDALDAEMWARSQKHNPILAAYANAGGEYWPAQYAKKRELMGEKTEVTGSDPYNPTNEEIEAAVRQCVEEVRPVFEALAAQREAASQEAEPLVEAVAEVNETVEEISKANGGGWNNYWNTHKIAAIETNS
jgi:hypothetical protein